MPADCRSSRRGPKRGSLVEVVDDNPGTRLELRLGDELMNAKIRSHENPPVVLGCGDLSEADAEGDPTADPASLDCTSPALPG